MAARDRLAPRAPHRPDSLATHAEQRTSRLRHPMLRFLGAAAVLALATPPAAAQVIDTTLWVTNGTVNAVVRDGNTIYIGGGFTLVGPSTGGGAALSMASGGPLNPLPRVHGSVSAVVPDGSGGWYIGGTFTAVGGLPRSNLAHILGDGTVAAWNPNANNLIDALALSGSTVYAGGTFTSIGGQARNCIAALDATTGAATAWNPNAAGGYTTAVYALAVGGGTVYAGGTFTSIGGQARNCIAALDATTGAATAWDPNASSYVYALTVSGGTVYAGGGFLSIGGQTRYMIAALDATTGDATAWNSYPNSTVYALAVSGGTVYVGGLFDRISDTPGLVGQARKHIAALDATTGELTAWDPSANGLVYSLAASGGTVYAGGTFTSIGGQARKRIAALDATTGAATAWDPNANNTVYALAVSEGTVYAGGTFTSVGGRARKYIAALDATTGAATAWDPNASNYVCALAVSGGTVYAGGAFLSIGGQPRICIAALDATTGAATAWDPNANNTVYALAVSGSKVYAGGTFTSIGGQARNCIAALDATTSAATTWDPNAAGGTTTVNALAVSGDTVYGGGSFSSIGGQARNCIAALDATTGAATAWDPNASSTVYALAVSGGTVYAGGYFRTIGGQARNYIAALDATTGAATAWDPNASSTVYALAVSGGTVYAGGSFSSIGGQARNCIAALDATSGAATAWDPNANSTVSALALSGSTVYAGGAFSAIGGQPRTGIAGMGDNTTGTLLARFDAELVSEGVLLRWQFSLPVRSVIVERAEHESGPWSIPPVEQRDGEGMTVALDRSAGAGRSYWYQLLTRFDDGTQMTFGPVRADVPAAIAVSGLTRLVPNPSSAVTRIDYVVARREPVRLSVLDVAGREIEVLAKATMEPGHYSVLWSGRGGRLTAGIYFVRFESPGRSQQKRLVLTP
jgi:hypothetical protein